FLANGKPVDGVIVPATAIVWWAGRAWVYRRTGDDTFTRLEIPVDMPAEQDGGFVVPAHLLADNDDVVITGAQMLLSEEFRSQIQ
ncbi:hypothetical protein MXD81_24015, partial [Microbacteriaceae bacterium K1510]|nr:hypothetical protein [Microbacteriaceae bacterium K1510]